MSPIRIGNDVIDTHDGRPCVVSQVHADGFVSVRKRALGSKRWFTYRDVSGRFLRPSMALRRKREAARYGPEVVRMAKALGLTFEQVANLK